MEDRDSRFVPRGPLDVREELKQAQGLIDGAITRVGRRAAVEPVPAQVKAALKHLEEARRNLAELQE